MLRLTIVVNCENSTFDDSNLYPEVARILHDVATVMGDEDYCNIHDASEMLLRDSNGNRVGSTEWEQS